MPDSPGLIRPYETEVEFASRLADMVWISVALYVASLIFGEPWQNRESLAAVGASLLFYFTSEATGLHRQLRGAPAREEIRRVAATWLATLAMLLVAAFLTKTSAGYSRKMMAAWAVLTPPALWAWRLFVRIALQEARVRGYNTRAAAIVGVSAVGERLAERIASSPWMGVSLVGFFDDRTIPRQEASTKAQLEVQGGFDTLVDKARRREVDMVYIALPPRAEPRINQLVGRLADTTASVYLAYDFGGYDLLRARWSSVGDVPIMSVAEDPFRGTDGLVKRLEDVILASIILTIIALPMMIIGLLVKLTSRGPVFFRQRRYGLNGEEIRVLKFRSMTVCEDGDKVVQAKRGDQRVTRLGAILRRTSLDELPQFFQVLTGTMSIVGPRPHAVAHNEQYRSLIRGYMRRHKVKPGITGWAQVNGWRGETETVDKMEKRVQYDLDYINRWNLGLDFKIIFLTIWTVLGNRNAY